MTSKRRPGVTPRPGETPDLFSLGAEPLGAPAPTGRVRRDSPRPSSRVPADGRTGGRAESATSRSSTTREEELAALAAPGESPAAAVSVATITQTVRDILEGAFPPLWVRGEVTDFKQHRNGHWYFSLRDREASLRCVIWSRDTVRIPAAPDEGMTVVAYGQVSVYPSRGDLQFTVRALEAVGDGLWRKAFERTRKRLEADGLLEPARKRALPYLPRCIAVITSADGAALHDIISVVRRRNPLVEIVLIPAAVQGDGAISSLCGALDRLARWSGADLAIIGRGGGSREDLWAFNDEKVARRIAASAIPIISAVGHDVDISICDMVADFRAPTPSVAAEHAVPMLSDLRGLTRRLGRRLEDSATARVGAARRSLVQASRRSAVAARRIVEHRRRALEGVAGTLQALSPLATMARGYAVVADSAGRPIVSAGSIRPNDEVQLRFRDGRVEARVQTVQLQSPTDGTEK